MCDSLVTKDGIELKSIGDLERYGLKVPSIFSRYAGSCLCALRDDDLADMLAESGSNWRKGGAPFAAYSEENSDGKTWWDGYEEKASSDEDWIELYRPDGRVAATLEEWEAGEVPIEVRLVCSTALWTGLWTGSQWQGRDLPELRCADCLEFLGPQDYDRPSFAPFAPYAESVARHYNLTESYAKQLLVESWRRAHKNLSQDGSLRLEFEVED